MHVSMNKHNVSCLVAHASKENGMQSIIKQVMQHVSKTLSFSHAWYFASKKTNSKIQSIAGKQIKKKGKIRSQFNLRCI